MYYKVIGFIFERISEIFNHKLNYLELFKQMYKNIILMGARNN